MSDLGVESDVVTFPIGRDVDIPGVRIFRAANPLNIRSVPVGFSFRKSFLDLFLGIRAARRALGGRRYTAVQASEEGAFVALPIARALGVPLIYDMQSSLPEQLAERWFFRLGAVRWMIERSERWLANRADMIITSAGLGAHAREIAPAALVREWAFHTEPPEYESGVRDRVKAEWKIRGDVPVILYAGTFAPYQGLSLLIRGFAKALQVLPDAVLVLVGSSQPKEKLLSGIDIPPHVIRVIPRQPRERVEDFYAAADLLVSPRVSGRNVPLKIFDYLGAGKPILATDIPAHRAVLNDKLALMVPAEVDAMADGIRRILLNEALGRSYAAAAATYTRERLGWDAFVERVRANYADVLEVVRERSGP